MEFVPSQSLLLREDLTALTLFTTAIDSMTSAALSLDDAHRNVSWFAGKHINILSGGVSRGSTCSNVSGLFEGDIHISTPILTSPTLPSYALITHL